MSTTSGSKSDTSTTEKNSVERHNPFEIFEVNDNQSSNNSLSGNSHTSSIESPDPTTRRTTETKTNTVAPTSPITPVRPTIAPTSIQQSPSPARSTPTTSPARQLQSDTLTTTEDDTLTEQSHSTAGNENIEEPKESTFSRFIESTKKILQPQNNNSQQNTSDDGDLDVMGGALLCGYLEKLGRNGKWQRRWFETDGECLSYFKSKTRTRVLATLDLEKVGDIQIDGDDESGRSFAIQVLGRMYHLRAESRGVCNDWVIMLNRVKEARLQQGNVKLISHSGAVPDLLDNGGSVTPRVVLVANRERTRAVAESQDWSNMIQNPANEKPIRTNPFSPSGRRTAIGSVVLARWTKRRSSLSRLGAKLSRWARSIKKYGCTDPESQNVELDPYFHPPGHDYKGSKSTAPASESKSKSLSSWIGKEGGVTIDPSVDMDPPKPRAMRAASDASEDIRVLS